MMKRNVTKLVTKMMFHPLYMFLFLILFLKRGVWGEKQRTTEDRRPETGKRKKTKSKKQKELWTDDALPENNVEAEFIDHFGSFNGKRERQRWETLVEAIGLVRAQEIAAWAERREIHLTNRGGLLDSLETAARKWVDNPGAKTNFLEQLKVA